MIIFDAILYAVCLLREYIIRLVQFFIGDPLDRLSGPHWFYAPYPEPLNTIPVCIITGGAHGIGWETALNVARNGVIKVIITTHNEKALEDIKKEFSTVTANPNVEVMPLDLTSFASIKAFAQTIQDRDLRVNILIHNSGILPGKIRQVTEDGFETSWQVNYVGPFLLNQLLLPNMKKAVPPARIIAVSSVAHVFGHVDMTDLTYLRRPFNYTKAYADAKLALLLFSKELQRRLDKEKGGVISVSLHPGLVASDFYDHYLPKNWLFGFKSVQSGARTSTFLALAPASSLQKGGYYSECVLAPHSFEAKDHVISELLWDETEKLINIKLAQK